jgi:hypothetical protein
MRPLSAAELLEAWEKAAGRDSLERSHILLRAAGERDSTELPLGERDARLLTLREWTFGTEVSAVTRCPQCKEEIELAFQVGDLRVEAKSKAEEFSISAEEYEIKFHLPNSKDIDAVRSEPADRASIPKRLLARCISGATHGGERISVESLPDSVVKAVSDQMAESDPQAEIELCLDCSSCKHSWKELFDVELFLWAEIQAWASRLLMEIHQLAASYGWSESDILAMSPVRRNIYLNLIAG